MSGGKRCVGQHFRFGLVEQCCQSREAGAKAICHPSPLFPRTRRVGLRKHGTDRCRHERLGILRHERKGVAYEVDGGTVATPPPAIWWQSPSSIPGVRRSSPVVPHSTRVSPTRAETAAMLPKIRYWLSSLDGHGSEMSEGVKGLSFRHERPRQMQQLARHRTSRHLHRLARRPQPLVEHTQHRVVAHRRERGKVGRCAQPPVAAVPDLRFAPHTRA